MSKEMFISSSPHETRVAVCEDDQLVELYLERDTDVGLVGGIYKGRVNRVLPGMQSAFVNIGLERDAFLYVSDFFMQGEEFEGLFDDEQPRVVSLEGASAPVSTAPQTAAEAAPPPEQVSTSEEVLPAPSAAAPGANESQVTPSQSAASVQPAASMPGGDHGYHRPGQRGRRRRRRGRGRFGDRDFAPRRDMQERPAQPQPPSAGFEVLPGESLAKYSHARHNAEPAETLPGPGVSGPSPEPVSQLEQQEPPTVSGPERSAQGADDSARQSGGQEGLTPEVNSAEPLGNSMRFTSEVSQAPEPPLPEESGSGAPAAFETPEEAETEGAESAETESAEEFGDVQAEAEDVFPEGVSQETIESAVALPAEEGSSGADSPAQTPESGERQFTLRDQHTRPHFAPRRRHRGRRGMRRGRKYERPRDASRSANNQPLQISELLKEGQEILVQIAKEPLGTKGARITSHIALPGRYLVCMPTISHIGVSRKISSEQERLRLRNLILEHRGSLTGGFIVRTAAEGRSDEELKADLKFLTTLWADIRSKAESAKAPALIYRDLDLVQRILRDTLTPDFKAVRADNEVDYERIVEFISRAQPALLPHVKLHTREIPLFDEAGIQAELEKALRPKVWLKSGGYIVINQTEALVAIDVNTGKYVGKTNRLEDTILKTNIDAVKEIVRQLRLRDLGGIIVIDFIDMDERRNRNRVVQALEEALRHDRAPTKVLAFNEFGLVALTRKRVKQSLQRTLCEPCEYCSGSGWVKSVTTVCNEILAEARKIAQEIDGKTLTLRVNPIVAKELKSKEGLMISEIESAARKDVVIKSDPNVHQERFEIF